MNGAERTGTERYEQTIHFLPLRWQRSARALSTEQKCRAEELRLRAGQPVTVLIDGREIPLSQELLQPSELEQLCDTVSGYSRYAVADTMAGGYLIAEGGFRIGLCGTAVLRDNKSTNLREISSAVIRISREWQNTALPLLPQLWENGTICSTLLISPPGGGKTTLLRDLIRLISNGTETYQGHRVAVADERGELAVMYHGLPQMDVGRHTDVLTGCPKAEAMLLLLRSNNPQVIAVDEITAPADLAAVAAAANCGVKLLATVHAGSERELQGKPLFAELLSMKVFERLIEITCSEGERTYRVSAL